LYRKGNGGAVSAKPKYQQVEEYIRGLISTGRISVGEKIPTEQELCNRFGFSRMTINKSLNNLAGSGYISRAPGKGSFVTAQHVRKSLLAAESFTEDMAHIGMKAGSRLLSYEVLPASEFQVASQKLGCASEELIHHFVRLRTGDGKPVALSNTYVSAKVIPAISVEALNESFYAYVKSLDIRVAGYDMEISATLPTEEQRQLLSLDDVAILQMTHVTYTEREGLRVPFEYITTYYNGDLYSYRFEM
jgi:GntR family transcriptional regulator